MKKISILVTFFLLFVSLIWGQLWTEDFESTGGYSTSIVEFTDNGTDYFIRTDGSNISGESFNNILGLYYFAAQDIDGDGAILPVTLTIDDVDISGYTNLLLKVYLAEDDDGTNQDWDAVDYVHIGYDIDNIGSFTPLLWIENSGSTFNTAPFLDTDFDGVGDGAEITDTFTQFTVSIPSTGSFLDIQIEFDLSDGDEDIAIDNIELFGDGPVPVNLSSFYATYIGGTPTLYWTTQTEENNDYWNVYRGTNENFETAAQINAEPVPGNGTTNYASDYVYVDTIPVVQNTIYWYWIEDVSTDGEAVVHEPITLDVPFEDTPNTYEFYGLHQNYPNPFNPSTSISFNLDEDSNVELIIYNVKGEKIKSIFNDHVYADQVNSAIWDGNDANGKQVSSGVYFYKLITDTKEYQRKMLLVK